MRWWARTVVQYPCAGGRVARSLSAIREAATVSARMTATPLIQISEERQQQELRRAIASGAAERRRAWRFHVIALLCLAWLLLGFALLGLAFHLTDGDQVRAAFLLAFLIGYGGPVWTLIIAHWSASQS